MVEYHHRRADSSSLSHNYIRHIYEDHRGQLWLATRNGLNCYSPYTETFRQYHYPETKNFQARNNIRQICEDYQGYIWYSTHDGVFRLDPHTEERLHFLPKVDQPHSLTHKNTFAIYEDQKKRLWFGTQNGITLYENDGSFKFRQILPNAAQNGLTTERFFGFDEQSDGTLWVSSDHGFFRIREEEDDFYFESLNKLLSDSTGWSKLFIEDFQIIGNEKIWLSTWDSGIAEISLASQTDSSYQITLYQNNPDDPASISMNKVSAILYDRSGLLWAGTGVGLDKLETKSKKFRTIEPIKRDPESL